MTGRKKDGKAGAKSAHRRGLDAENIAALYLRCKGYRILERRFRTYNGEIDIIAKRLNTIAFVEVKFRRSHENAAEAIDRINQSRVRRAAELYLMKHSRYTVLELRFDALVMAPGRLPQHITNAF